jgi:hypothetical protein
MASKPKKGGEVEGEGNESESAELLFTKTI